MVSLRQLEWSGVSEVLGDVRVDASRALLLKHAYGWYAFGLLTSALGAYAGNQAALWQDQALTWPGIILSTILFAFMPKWLLTSMGGAARFAIATLGLLGGLSGFLMAPYASKIDHLIPHLVPQISINATIVFLTVGTAVFSTRETFHTVRGLIAANGIALFGAIGINLIMGFDAWQVLASTASGCLLALVLMSGTTELLRDGQIRTPLHGGITLFASTFNILISLSLLARRIMRT